MNECSVHIILSELTIVAATDDRAEEIAMKIYGSGATPTSLMVCLPRDAVWMTGNHLMQKKRRFKC